MGVGLAVTATFFVDYSPHDARAEVAPAEKVSTASKQPDLPVAAGKIDKAIQRENRREKQQRKDAGKRVVKKHVVPRGPENKTLRMTIPKMAQIRNDTVPYAESDDDKAFHDYAAVHLRGTGNPWNRQANVYIAGHRLGFPGTDSWLGFWDLNVLEKGDKIYITDADGKHYVYKVFKIFIVEPTEVSVIRPIQGKNILTLQTCTLPDYSNRLIIRAEKVS
ncbi:MAG TPA: class E sortase [Rubrobacter sp.]|nr:class E sortase [Rubrobacter sp.]